jgi:hypothetical protein
MCAWRRKAARGCWGAGRKGGVKIKRKASSTFFEKSNQKTFVLGFPVLKTARAQEQKFFAELFYKKATACLLCLTSFQDPSM